RLAEGQDALGALGHRAVLVERGGEEELGAGVGVLLGLERVQDHPEHGEEEDQPDDPGQDAERAVDGPALADGGRGGFAHAASSPSSRWDRTRSESVAITIEASTTTMLYADAWP